MKTKILIIILAVVAIALAGGAIYLQQKTIQPKPQACTQEAKLCPDGSYVSRTGPNCEFAACPEIKVDTTNWKTYRNEQYGFEVKYPSGFTLYTDVSKVTNLTYAPVCDDKMVICLYFPKEMYPGTDFEGAGVSVNVLSQYNTESKCSVFNPAVFPPERLTGKKRINDIAFETAFGGGAGLGHSQENHFYRTFHNERCFEIDLVININDIIRSDIEYGDRMGKVVDENEVLEKLNQILSTFKFIK